MQPNIQTALAERTDQPKDYERLTTANGDALAAWIATTMHAIKAANLYQTSSTLKAVFKRSSGWILHHERPIEGGDARRRLSTD